MQIGKATDQRLAITCFKFTKTAAIDQAGNHFAHIAGGSETGGKDAIEFNRVLDKYLWQNNIDVGDFEQLNLAQQAVLQEIKKSKARNK